MVKPRNPNQSPAALRANSQEGYGANNPEPGQFKAGGGKKAEKRP